MTDADLICKCGRPTREGRTFCEACADNLAYALGEVPWLEEQLEITTTRSKGVDYRTRGGTPSGERPSPVVWSATDARINLRGFLIAWTRFCHDNDIRNSSPVVGMPAGNMPTLTALSRYLMWRVDGLALTDRGPAAVEQITKAVGQPGTGHSGPTGVYRLIDNAPEKLYAGKCGYELESTDTTCTNELYVRIGAKVIKCSVCGTEWDVPERRTWLLAEAEEVLATAVEISRAVSWLGTEPLTAERVRKWASRDRLTTRGHDRDNRPLYRVGDAIDLLASNATKGSAA